MSITKIISKITAKRIVNDIKDIKKSQEELAKNGIYYEHDEENLLKGYAMIVGPTDTPYNYGYYFFTFNFPDNYPFNPPRLIYESNDGETRFNPNLYVNGKVCISILNTWNGDQWTSCQSIRTILLTLITILNNNPLENEPGFTKLHYENNNYNLILTYKNLEYCIYEQLVNKKFKKEFEIFYSLIKTLYLTNKNEIMKLLYNLKEKHNNEEIIKTQIFSLKCRIDFSKLITKFDNIKL